MGQSKANRKSAALAKGILDANEPDAPSIGALSQDQERYLLSLLRVYFRETGAARRVSTEDFGVYDLRYVHLASAYCVHVRPQPRGCFGHETPATPFITLCCTQLATGSYDT